MATTNLIGGDQNDYLIYEKDTTPAKHTFRVTEDSTPVNFTGAVIVMPIRKPKPANDLTATLSTANGKITIGGGGSNEVTISGWEDIPYNSSGYVYDFRVTLGGQTRTYMFGKITVKEDVPES